MGRTLTPSGVRRVGATTGTRLCAEVLGRALRKAAGLPLFSDPRFLALRIGCDLAVGDERCTARLAVYPHADDPRLQGLLAHLAVAEVWLIRSRISYDAAEVADLAAEVALPLVEIVGRCPLTLIASQVFVPIAVIRERFSWFDTG